MMVVAWVAYVHTLACSICTPFCAGSGYLNGEWGSDRAGWRAACIRRSGAVECCREPPFPLRRHRGGERRDRQSRPARRGVALSCRHRGKASLLEMLGRTLKLLFIGYVPELAPFLPRVPP